jgi:DNA mismatch endonuclease (patch repair protein)
MTDKFTPEKRSRIMSAVRSKNTGPELLIRRFLRSKGVGYRIHNASLPGKPDITVPRYKVAVFIHGCFWHGHEGCPRGRLPKSRVEYWSSKIEANKQRDRLVEKRVSEAGWQPLVIWECQLRTQKAASVTLDHLLDNLYSLSKMGKEGRSEGSHDDAGAS